MNKYIYILLLAGVISSTNLQAGSCPTGDGDDETSYQSSDDDGTNDRSASSTDEGDE